MEAAAALNEFGGTLHVGQPVRAKRAGEWLSDWCEVLRCLPDGKSYYVMVKPNVDQIGGTVGDKTDIEFGCPTKHGWYVLKDKESPDEVRALDPEQFPEEAELERKYQEYLQRDGGYLQLVLDEKKLRSSTVVKVARNRGGAAVEVLVHLVLMHQVLSAMTKIGGGTGPLTRNQRPTWFVHNDESKRRLKENWQQLVGDIEQELAKQGAPGVRVARVFVAGHNVLENEALKDPGSRWSHELQRSIVWAADHKRVIVVTDSADEAYDRDKWKKAAEDGHGKSGMCDIL